MSARVTIQPSRGLGGFGDDILGPLQAQIAQAQSSMPTASPPFLKLAGAAALALGALQLFRGKRTVGYGLLGVGAAVAGYAFTRPAQALVPDAPPWHPSSGDLIDPFATGGVVNLDAKAAGLNVAKTTTSMLATSSMKLPGGPRPVFDPAADPAAAPPYFA